MVMSTAASVAAAGAAPLSLLLRSSSAAAALRLTSVRAAPLSLPRSSAPVRPPRLAASFSASTRSLQKGIRVSSVSVSAPPSALSAAAPPRSDLSQSAAHSRSLSTKQVGSSLSAPLRDQSSASSSLFRPSSASSTGLRSAHFSASPFAHAASGQLVSRSFSTQSNEANRLFSQLLDQPSTETLNRLIWTVYNKGYGELVNAHLNRPPGQNARDALQRLTSIEQSESDPLVSTLLQSLQTIEEVSTNNPSSLKCVWELHRMQLRLADVALWMPATPTTRALWLWFGIPLLSPSPLDPLSVESAARATAAIERLRTIDDPKARMLSNCLLTAESACQASRATDRVVDLRALQAQLSVLSLLLPRSRAWRWQPDEPELQTRSQRRWRRLTIVTTIVMLNTLLGKFDR